MSLSREQLVSFMQDELRLDMSQLGSDTLLFSGGVLDSFSMVDLVMFLEKTGDFTMSATEVNLDNLDTIERILAFVLSKDEGRRTKDEKRDQALSLDKC
jgi:acyl carrier protein